MAATPDYYKTLGVPRTATADEIKKAFRKLARTHHRRRRRRGEVQRAERSVRGAVGRQETQALRPVRHGEREHIPQGWGGGSVNVEDIFGGAGGGFGSWADILESIRHGEGAFGTDWDFNDMSGFGGAASRVRARART